VVRPRGQQWITPTVARPPVIREPPPDVERDAEPDVTVTTDVVDWCRVASERLPAAELHRVVDGDEQLAEDLLTAAPAFATL
jgi:hypothetical protein